MVVDDYHAYASRSSNHGSILHRWTGNEHSCPVDHDLHARIVRPRSARRDAGRNS